LVPWNPAPTPFLRHNEDWLAGGCFQPEFVRGQFRFLVGIEPGRSKQLVFFGKGLELDSEKKPTVELQDAICSLKPQGNLSLVHSSTGEVLWSNDLKKTESQHSIARFTEAGRLEVVDASTGTSLWNPLADFPKLDLDTPCADFGPSPRLVLRDSKPYLTIQDKQGDTLFLSHYVFGVNWRLNGGQFVGMRSSTGFVWLYLDSSTSTLFLHSSKLPHEPLEDQVLWKSANFKQKKAECFVVLQGCVILSAFGLDSLNSATATSSSIPEVNQRGRRAPGPILASS
jgi:hypothetical protein